MARVVGQLGSGDDGNQGHGIISIAGVGPELRDEDEGRLNARRFFCAGGHTDGR
jgi:hypothetical protein